MAFFRKPKQQCTTATTPGERGRGRGDPKVETETFRIGAELLTKARGSQKGFFTAKFWSDKLMDWSMKDEAFKIQLFRFVDTFPMLKTPEQIHEHLVDYLTQPGVKLPAGMAAGLKTGGLAKGVMSKTMTSQIEGMGKKFIAGVDAQDAYPTLQKIWKNNLAFSVDLLGEACVSDAEAKIYQKRYLDLVNTLPDKVNSWKEKPELETDHLGPIPRTNVSIKISSLYAKTNPIDFEGSLRGLMDAILPILHAAKEKDVLVNFDMEQFEYKDLTLELFMRCCDEVDFTAGIAMQAYLRSGNDDAQKIIDWSKRTGRHVTVRLVKGAYWDFETIHAEQMGWEVPVWSVKQDTDACFERMTKQFIQAMPRTNDQGGVKLALGSHNVRSIAYAKALLDENDLPINSIELQMLYGMADELKVAGHAAGFRIREYLPVGEMIPGMAYLVRRLLENTSNESWLKAGFLDNASPESLLKSPHRTEEEQAAFVDPGIQRIAEAKTRHNLSDAHPDIADGKPFFSLSMRDFAKASEREAFQKAVDNCTVETVLNDATVEQADKAVETAFAAFPDWRDKEQTQRSNIMVKAAQLMTDRRDELSAIIIKESGKPWAEADADVCEAIDFLDYYARNAMKLATPQRLGQFVGELNEQWYQPRGVSVVISPWNFPLAICAGMTAAALVTGNTAVVKPAEQTPAIAKAMTDIFWQAGIPKDVLHFLAGNGETVGAALVRDKRVSVIAFTGSKAVGLDIIQASGITPENQPFVKKVVCEMGGKNAIIIDASADLDEAVLGVRYSAFGFSGQKCSACSRVIVVESAHDLFVERLVQATKTLVVGDPSLPGTDVGPVIDQDAADKCAKYIQIGKQEGKLELAMDVPAGVSEKIGLPLVGPHIFSGISPDDKLANDEIFGPVIAIIKVPDFATALKVANSTDYKLTGGIYSRKPTHLDIAKKEFRVGNLYINRPNTGALVGRQPFGGFGLSGVGSKAGGADYLLQFVEPRICTENTMRCGFAPGL